MIKSGQDTLKRVGVVETNRDDATSQVKTTQM